MLHCFDLYSKQKVFEPKHVV